MDNALLIAIIGVGGTISAVILNWLANQIREARQRRNLRKLIGLENDYNLEGLRKVWETVTEPLDVSGGLGYSTEEEAFVRRHRLATQLIQPWAHLMWGRVMPNC